jgi:hypothetical protein
MFIVPSGWKPWHLCLGGNPAPLLCFFVIVCIAHALTSVGMTVKTQRGILRLPMQYPA